MKLVNEVRMYTDDPGDVQYKTTLADLNAFVAAVTHMSKSDFTGVVITALSGCLIAVQEVDK